MSWTTIRTGMQTVIAANTTGISVYDVMPQAVNDDAAVVLPGEPLIESWEHGTKMKVVIRVMVRAHRGSGPDGQKALDAIIAASGTKSVRAAVDADRTLNGTVDVARFVRVSNYGLVEGEAGTFQADIDFVALAVA